MDGMVCKRRVTSKANTLCMPPCLVNPTSSCRRWSWPTTTLSKTLQTTKTKLILQEYPLSRSSSISLWHTVPRVKQWGFRKESLFLTMLFQLLQVSEALHRLPMSSWLKILKVTSGGSSSTKLFWLFFFSFSASTEFNSMPEILELWFLSEFFCIAWCLSKLSSCVT